MDLLRTVTALFVGAGTLFGFMSYVSGATYVTATITELVYCMIGLVFGWMTVNLRGCYEAYVEQHETGHGEHVPH